MLVILALACFAPPTATAAPASDFGWVDVSQRAAPMALTASDGTGLSLTKMQVDAVVEGPLAFTELHLTFQNPEARQIEGRFEITLPTGAAVSRFAMKLGDHWQEGEVVELQAARRAYEDFLHRRTDPALLEYDAGNEFRARVFPIEANGSKEIILSWSHDLDVGEAWTLPTGGLPELGLLDAKVTVGGKTHTMVTEYAVPEGDLSLAVPDAAKMAYRGANTSVVRLRPELSVRADGVANATVLVDTSASRALSFDTLLNDLAAVIPTFSGSVRVLAYDQSVQTIYEGKASAFGEKALAALRERGPLGASDLTAALAQVGKVDRLVVFTDGVVTAGEREVGPLIEQVDALGIGRVDAVVRGGARDEALLGQWVAAGDRDGVMLDADAMESKEVARRLGLGTAGKVVLEVPGADWIYPRTVSGLQPGDSLTVYVDLPRDQRLDLQLDGRSVGKLPITNTEGPLLTRASAQAEIGALLLEKGQADGAEGRQAVIDEIVAVSTRNRVLSPHTALLVLETEADYARFGIPRDALTDILSVDAGELTWLKRSKPVLGSGTTEDAPVDTEKESGPEEEQKKGRAKSMPAADAEQEEMLAPMEMALDDAPPSPTLAPQRAEEAARAAEGAAAARHESERRASASRPARERRARQAAEVAAGEMLEEPGPMSEAAPPAPAPDPLAGWEGPYREAKRLLLADDVDGAMAHAKAWLAKSPGDPLALLALGEAFEAKGDLPAAARAYGSLIDLFPSRADLRRLAGERLETLGAAGLPMAVDTFRVAVEQRADHPSGHRLLAWALQKQGDSAGALEVLVAAFDQSFDRFEAAQRILREDAGLIAASHEAKGGDLSVLEGTGVEVSTQPDLRFVLNWETDANDVDFHIYDAEGGHAYYSSRNLGSGGSLYADITTGYGPECFSIAEPEAFPYTLQAHYYSRGPMGFGMGKLSIVEHDGAGDLRIEDRPFVVMTDGAFVPLGTVDASQF